MLEIETALWIHCIGVGIAVVAAAVILRRRGLLTFLHTGFWMISAMVIFFIYNPLSTLLSRDFGRYREALSLITRDGTFRVYWILGVVLAGFAVSFWVYLKGRTKETEAALETAHTTIGRWSVSQISVLGFFFLTAMYSLLFFRTSKLFVKTEAAVEYENGQIVGGATGYSLVAHAFFLYIVTILLLRGGRTARAFGWIFAFGFVLIRLFDAHGRWTVVSLIAAVGMVEILRARSIGEGSQERLSNRKRVHFKNVLIVLGSAIMAIFLSVRGHSSIEKMDELNWRQGQNSLRKADTAMLPILYVESKLAEIHGYDFGVPLVSKVVLGWLPSRWFPWKGDLDRMLLNVKRPRFGPSIDNWLYGAKSTVIGSFYNHGGVVGVLLGMGLIGLLSRYLDRMTAAGRTDLSRALGVVWMASVWMMLASSDVWIIQNLFIYSMPFFGLYAAKKLFPYEEATS